MQRRLMPLLAGLALALAGPGCRKPEQTTTLIPAPDPQVFVVARLDASILGTPSAQAEPVGSVLEGDQLSVLGEEGEFSRIRVHSTGTSGWMYSNLCLYLPPNPYWEGDTHRARELAQRIYREAFLTQRTPDGRLRFPITKVRVEAAYNTLTLIANEGQPRPLLERSDAQELGVHYFGRLKELYPEWKEPMVYVKGHDRQAEYLLTVGPDRKPRFL
jgi:hypothetical protein